MIVIRLQRTGRRNAPAYRLVVAEKSRPVKGKFLEILGHYLPTRSPVEFTFNKEETTKWIQNGAIPSETVARLLKNHGLKIAEKYITRYTKRVDKNAPVEAPAPVKAPAAPLAQTTSESTPAEVPADTVEAPESAAA